MALRTHLVSGPSKTAFVEKYTASDQLTWAVPLPMFVTAQITRGRPTQEWLPAAPVVKLKNRLNRFASAPGILIEQPGGRP